MAEPTSDLARARARIAASVTASLGGLVSAAVEAIWAQVPAYGASPDPRLRDDVAEHVTGIFRAFLAGLAADTLPGRADFAMTRQQATRRVNQGISLADFLQAFRIGQLTLWQGVLDAAGGDEVARDAALRLAGQIMSVIELGSTVAGEAYLEAQQHQVAEHDRVRRDLIEDLLAGRAVVTGQKRSILRAAGLAPDTSLLVVCATPAISTSPGVAAGLDAGSLTAAAPMIAGSGLGGSAGLATLLQGEVVAVLAAPSAGLELVVASLHRIRTELAAVQVPVAIGVSTVHAGLHEVPDAYAEAQVARDGLGQAGGVLALPLLTAFEYLVLRESRTAQRLIRPLVRNFVTEDMAAGGALIATLTEYAACDLNAKVAAERLHLHVNTAYYRMERIAERTGADLRRLVDVVELLIAIRLLGGAAPPTS